MIIVNDICCGYNNKIVLPKVSFQIEPGHSVCVLGGNGVGKTTLVRTLLSLIPKISGEIFIDDDEISNLSYENIAMKIALVPQAKSYTYSHFAIDIVMMGRARYIGKFSVPSEVDYIVAQDAMKMLGIMELANKPYNILSGGEQQLVMIARALVQRTNYLIFDEPAANLDLANQRNFLEAIEILKGNGKGILMVSHSPSHALLCCEESLLIYKNKSYMYGPTHDVITTKSLQQAYENNKIELVSTMTDAGKSVEMCIFI